MKKHPLLAACACLAWPLFLFAQKEDNVWILGQNRPGLDTAEVGLRSMNFKENPPVLQPISIANYTMDFTNASISDSLGNLQCYTNGVSLLTKEHKTMQNGDALHNPLTWSNGYYNIQGALMLPVPLKPDSIVLLLSEHFVFLSPWDMEYHSASNGVSYSLIEMKKNGGLGKVIQKKVPLVTDTLIEGQMSACRHGNGRDWWVLLNRQTSNKFHRVLLSPDGIAPVGTQEIGNIKELGVGQAAFSPDGNWFARYNTIYGDKPNWIDVFNFDRCTGILSNPVQFTVGEIGYWGGLAFSPNSQFMYVSARDTVYQFDVLATDIPLSRTVVAVQDSMVLEDSPTGPKPTRFFMMQLAPDGKIYINVPNYQSKYLHVIEQPDLKGPACNLVQHGFYLGKRNSFSLPNFPFFRLGKSVGSLCDTIVGTTGEITADRSFGTLSPNPGTGVFQYAFEKPLGEPATVFITNLTGATVFSQALLKNEATVQLDLGHLAPGIYVFEVRSAARRLAIQKLIISKP